MNRPIYFTIEAVSNTSCYNWIYSIYLVGQQAVPPTEMPSMPMKCSRPFAYLSSLCAKMKQTTFL
jgi:hypothetical protein